jgi:flagellar hook protein FlgE
MITSLFAGISGLNANATAMTVIGDNIANVNTIAYKATKISFANVLAISLAGSARSQIGRGVQVWDTGAIWNQGSQEGTGGATDLSVNGIGFFIVSDEELGDFVNPDGLHVMGYPIDDTGAFGSLTQISIPGDRVSNPRATTEFAFDINLDAGALPNETYSASQTVYDSLGNPVEITLTFTNVASGSWTVAASVPPSVGTGVTLDGLPSIPVTFDAFGALVTPAGDVAVAVTLTNGADTPLNMNWDLYDALGISAGDLTGYANPSSTTFQRQDGYPSGLLRGISVDEDGTVSASYSNGQLVPVYMLALADFPSYEGLNKMGSNLWAESLESGQALPGRPGVGRLGNISPGTIEMSNVDLAKEFVNMITAQRAFQANSRVITTSDEILAELINIKR